MLIWKTIQVLSTFQTRIFAISRKHSFTKKVVRAISVTKHKMSSHCSFSVCKSCDIFHYYSDLITWHFKWLQQRATLLIMQDESWKISFCPLGYCIKVIFSSLLIHDKNIIRIFWGILLVRNDLCARACVRMHVCCFYVCLCVLCVYIVQKLSLDVACGGIDMNRNSNPWFRFAFMLVIWFCKP